jgi:hypothetical protein
MLISVSCLIVQCAKGSIYHTTTKLNLPVGIILKSNPLRRGLPIPHLPPTGIDLLVVIVTFAYTGWDVLAILEMNALPRTYLTGDILQAKGVESSLGCLGGCSTYGCAVDAA